MLHSIQGERDTGSIAMINSDVLSQASLMAGPHPLKDGNWLGPTLSFDMREGSRDRTSVRVAVSGTSASTVLEGPIGGSHKGSWLFSLRKSYIDWLVQKIAPDVSDTVGFIDSQAKLAYDLTNRQQISMTFVAGNGDFNQNDATGINSLRKAVSKSALVSIGWRYARSSWVVTQRASYATNVFVNKGSQGQEQGSGNAPSISYRGDATWQINRLWSADFGARREHSDENLTLTNYTTTAGVLKVRSKLNASLTTTDTDGWGQLTFRTPHGGFAAGARSATDSLTDRTAAAPWLLGEVHLGRFILRAGAGESHQFASLDLQAASIPKLGPSEARSIDAGIAHEIGRGFLWQVSGWTRQNQDIVRQIGEDQLVNGKRMVATLFPEFASTLDGRSRGVDLLFARHSATGVTGWVAYTYAHTRFHDHTTGENFDGDFDQRHTLNTFVEARLSYRLAVNARFRYGSNFPIVGYFSGTPFNLVLATTRNMVRLPEYARLDLRVNRTFTFHTKRLTLFVEVMNLLNRDNYGQSPGSISSTTLVAKDIVTRLIPRIPSAGFLFEF